MAEQMEGIETAGSESKAYGTGQSVELESLVVESPVNSSSPSQSPSLSPAPDLMQSLRGSTTSAKIEVHDTADNIVVDLSSANQSHLTPTNGNVLGGGKLKRKSINTSVNYSDADHYHFAENPKENKKVSKSTKMTSKKTKLSEEVRGVPVGTWRDSDVDEKPVVHAFFDQNGRLRARVYSHNPNGDPHQGALPSGAGGCWVTWPVILKIAHLKDLNDAEIKAYVKLRPRLQPIDPFPDLDACRAQDFRAVQEAKQAVANQGGIIPDYKPPRPLSGQPDLRQPHGTPIHGRKSDRPSLGGHSDSRSSHGTPVNEHNPARPSPISQMEPRQFYGTSGLNESKLGGPVIGGHPESRQFHSITGFNNRTPTEASLNARPYSRQSQGTPGPSENTSSRPSIGGRSESRQARGTPGLNGVDMQSLSIDSKRGIMLGFWKESDSPNDIDKHAVHGMLSGENRMRTKVMRQTRDGRPLLHGNFPDGAGNFWKSIADVQLEPHIAHLSHHELREYVRMRLHDQDSGETAETRKRNELMAANRAPAQALEFAAAAAARGGHDEGDHTPALRQKIRRRRTDEDENDVDYDFEDDEDAAYNEGPLIKIPRDVRERTFEKLLRNSEAANRSRFMKDIQKLNDIWIAQKAVYYPGIGLRQPDLPRPGNEEVISSNGIKYIRKKSGQLQGKFVSSTAQLQRIDGKAYMEYRVLKEVDAEQLLD